MEFIHLLLFTGAVAFAIYLHQREKSGTTPEPEHLTDNQNSTQMNIETENPKAGQADTSQNSQNRNFHTKDFLLETLTRMNIAYEIDSNDNDHVSFSWQGGHFCVDASNDCPFIVIWFFQWDEWELYDIDTLARVKRVINETNIQSAPTIVYSVNEAASTFSVHSKIHALFIPEIPYPETYLQTLLGDFFRVCRHMETELDKLKNQEESR